MKRTKPKADPRPKDPPEDEPGPQLLTQKRAANQVEALYLELAKVIGRLEGLIHYVDSQTVQDCLNALTAELRALMGIRARLLTGEIAIVRGEDRETWAKRQPLLAIAEASANGQAEVPSPPAEPELSRVAGRRIPMIAPADIERFWAGGELSLRYRGIPVWAAAPKGQAFPIYGVAAASRAAAAAFVKSQHPTSARPMPVRALTLADLARCSVYYDARPEPSEPSARERPAKPPRKAKERSTARATEVSTS